MRAAAAGSGGGSGSKQLSSGHGRRTMSGRARAQERAPARAHAERARPKREKQAAAPHGRRLMRRPVAAAHAERREGRARAERLEWRHVRAGVERRGVGVAAQIVEHHLRLGSRAREEAALQCLERTLIVAVARLHNRRAVGPVVAQRHAQRRAQQLAAHDERPGRRARGALPLRRRRAPGPIVSARSRHAGQTGRLARARRLALAASRAAGRGRVGGAGRLGSGGVVKGVVVRGRGVDGAQPLEERLAAGGALDAHERSRALALSVLSPVPAVPLQVGRAVAARGGAVK